MVITWEGLGVIIAAVTGLVVCSRYVIRADIRDAMKELDDRYMRQSEWKARIEKLEHERRKRPHMVSDWESPA